MPIAFTLQSSEQCEDISQPRLKISGDFFLIGKEKNQSSNT